MTLLYSTISTDIDRLEKRRLYMREYNSTHPKKQYPKSREMINAHATANYHREHLLRKSCEAIKPNGEMCNSTRYLMLHHPDYSRPLWTYTTCASCHNKLRTGEVTLLEAVQ